MNEGCTLQQGKDSKAVALYEVDILENTYYASHDGKTRGAGSHPNNIGLSGCDVQKGINDTGLLVTFTTICQSYVPDPEESCSGLPAAIRQ